MSPLSDLPNELLDRIVTFLPKKSDIANLRLVNHPLSAVATRAYFRSVPLYAYWLSDEDSPPPAFPNNIDYDAHFFKNILDSDSLKALVKEADIYTCNPDCDHHPHWANGWSKSVFKGKMGSDELHRVWEQCFGRLPEFEQLRSITMHFDRHGSGDQDDCYDLLQSAETKRGWVEELFSLMGTQIKDLSLRNFQDNYYADSKPDKAEALREAVLGGLHSLRVSVVSEQVSGETGSTLKFGNSHRCWEHFPTRWLMPATQNLKHLTLYSDLPLGWFPKLDLRNVHFVNLESLALGQFVFQHERQFDWIISHQASLRAFYLDHCSILYQIGHSSDRKDWLDAEGYPTYEGYYNWPESHGPESSMYEDTNTTFEEALTFVSCPTRWHDVFDRFLHSLPKLHTFRFGSSEQWKWGTPNRRDDFSAGMPIMPWKAETTMKNELFEDRYMVYDDWGEDYYPRWGESDQDEIDFENDKEVLARIEEFPDCEEQDRRALDMLLRELKDRPGS